MRDEHTKEIIKFGDRAEVFVIRGPESWNFIYFGLAFSIAIEGTIIQMLTPRLLDCPWNIVFYFILAIATICLFIYSGQFQNFVFTVKHKYESRAR